VKRDGGEEEKNGDVLKEELESVIKKMRIDRAPEEDDVVAELIKCDGPTMVEAMHELTVMV
jgi:hypothetical protein